MTDLATADSVLEVTLEDRATALKSRFDSHYCAGRHKGSAHFNFFSKSLKIEKKILDNKTAFHGLIKSYDFSEIGQLSFETGNFLDEL